MTSSILDGHAVTTGQQITVSIPGHPAAPFTGAAVSVTPHINDLGGRWATITVDVDGVRHTFDSRAAVITTPDVDEFGWCSTCRRSRLITERSTESALDLGAEQHYAVTWYDCGHQDATHTGSSAAAGAPWAPGAHRTRRDAQRAAARDAAAYNDPWEG